MYVVIHVCIAYVSKSRRSRVCVRWLKSQVTRTHSPARAELIIFTHAFWECGFGWKLEEPHTSLSVVLTLGSEFLDLCPRRREGMIRIVYFPNTSVASFSSTVLPPLSANFSSPAYFSKILLSASTCFSLASIWSLMSKYLEWTGRTMKWRTAPTETSPAWTEVKKVRVHKIVFLQYVSQTNIYKLSLLDLVIPCRTGIFKKLKDVVQSCEMQNFDVPNDRVMEIILMRIFSPRLSQTGEGWPHLAQSDWMKATAQESGAMHCSQRQCSRKEIGSGRSILII